jgi:antirestriction protein ArdC
MRKDLNQRITDQIVEELEKGVPWIKPWSADHMAGRVIKPLRHNSVGYQGINVLVLWAEAMAKGYAAPIWMTFRQALALGEMCARAKREFWSSMRTRSAAPKPMSRPTKKPRTTSTT